MALAVEPEPEFPLPKFQVQDVGPPVERSENVTWSGAQPAVVFAEKFAFTCAEI